MIGRKGKATSGGLGRHTLVYEQNVPTFLKRVLDKNDQEQQKQDKILAARAIDRADLDDEAPVIIAEEDIRQEWEKQELVKSELLKKQEILQQEERREHEEERMKQKLIAKSKFATNEETTHVFRKGTKRKVEEGEVEKREDKKARKGDVKKSLLSFGQEEDE